MPKIGTSGAFVFFGGQVLCLQGINVSGSREWRGGGGEPPLCEVFVLWPQRTISFDSFSKRLNKTRECRGDGGEPALQKSFVSLVTKNIVWLNFLKFQYHRNFRASSSATCANKKDLAFKQSPFCLPQRLPTFPGSCPPSIIGTTELNYCVRYGYRCVLRVIITEFLNTTYHHLLSSLR